MSWDDQFGPIDSEKFLHARVLRQLIRGSAALRRDAPYHIADIVGDEKCAFLVDLDAHGPTVSVTVLVDEPVRTSIGLPSGFPSLKGTKVNL
jgi:hypothetical protein